MSTIAPNDTNILYSPYTWDVTATRAATINNGAYFRAALSGDLTGASLTFDVSALLTPLPVLAYRWDSGAWTRVTIAATVSIPAPSGATGLGTDSTAAWSIHTLEVVVDATTETQNRWAGAATQVRFTGLTTTNTAATTALNRRPLNGLLIGDSITEGVRTLALNPPSGGGDVLRNCARSAWAHPLGELLGAEVGCVGFGGTGLTKAGSGSVPQFTDSYSWLWSGQARSFTSPAAPDFVALHVGTNDPDTSAPQANMVALLNGLIAATPTTTKIIALETWCRKAATYLQAACTLCTAPARVTWVNTEGWVPGTTGGSLPWTIDAAYATDGVHPLGNANVALLSPKIAGAVSAVLRAGSGNPRKILTASGWVQL